MHSKKACYNHVCNYVIDMRIQFALINWISIKMLSLNSIEHPFIKKFCFLLNVKLEIPKPKILSQMIINYLNLIIENTIKSMKSQYVSVMLDGATK